jgi:hypothetical protein
MNAQNNYQFKQRVEAFFKYKKMSLNVKTYTYVNMYFAPWNLIYIKQF